jgi:flagellar biosynthesis protein FlhA
VQADRLLAITPPGGAPALSGKPTRDPTFGLAAYWIAPSEREQAQLYGYTAVDPASVIVTHLTEVLRRHAAELVGRQHTQEMLDAVSSAQPKLVSEVVPGAISLGNVQKILQSLLRENVSVRDLPTILEAIGDYADKTKDTELLTELVRERLAAQISAELAPDGKLEVLVLSPEIDRLITSGVQRTEHGSLITLDPATIARIVGSVRQALERSAALHPNLPVLCAPGVRPHLRRMLERALPRTPVITANELGPDTQVESVGTVAMS